MADDSSREPTQQTRSKRNGEKSGQRPTEKTPKTGITVPIPKRGEFFANLKKVAGKEREHLEPEQPGRKP